LLGYDQFAEMNGVLSKRAQVCFRWTNKHVITFLHAENSYFL